MQYRVKDIKPLINDIGGDAKLVKTNRSNFMVIESQGMKFLTSYSSFVAIETADKMYVNSNYTRPMSKGAGWKMCSVTTASHLRQLTGKPMERVDFSDVMDTLFNGIVPACDVLCRTFNVNGAF